MHHSEIALAAGRSAMCQLYYWSRSPMPGVAAAHGTTPLLLAPAIVYCWVHTTLRDRQR